MHRGLFIIDGHGILKQITVNDLPVGRSVDEVLRLVKAFQFTDKNGEVCPANWSPGSKTVKQIFTFRVTDPSSAKPLNQIDLHRHVDKSSTKPNNHHHNNNNSTSVVTNATASTTTAPSTNTATSTTRATTTNATKVVVQNNTSTNHDKTKNHHYNHSVHPDKKDENGNSKKTNSNKKPSKTIDDQQHLVHCKICTIY